MKNKKGFSILKLVIVIAVITIIGSVLFFAFNGMAEKAKISADIQTVKNFNTVLALKEALDGKNGAMHFAVEDLIKAGYHIEDLLPSSKKNDILWNSKNDRFLLVNKTGSIIYSENSSNTEITGQDIQKEAVHFFKYYYSFEDYSRDLNKSGKSKGYSVYAGDEWALEVHIGVGFDVGYNSDISAIYLEREDDSSECIVRTNGGVFSLDDKLGEEIFHYGEVSFLIFLTDCNVIYHEFGSVANVVNAGTVEFYIEESAVFNQSLTALIEIIGAENLKNIPDNKEGAFEQIIEPAVDEKKLCSLGHNNVVIQTISEATCTGTGVEIKKCLDCNQILETKMIAEKAHQESQWIIDNDSTCYQVGTKHKECINCHEKLEEDIIELKAHVYPDSVTYEWSKNVGIVPGESLTCIATKGCATVGCTEKISVNGVVQFVITKEPSENDKGVGTYIAHFEAPYIDQELIVEIPRKMLSYTDNGNGTCIITGRGTYSGSDIIIPESLEGMTVTGVSDGAFANDVNLVSVHLPSTLQSIGKSSFEGCSISSIVIPESVNYIGARAFNGCPLVSANIENLHSFSFSQKTVSVIDEYNKISYSWEAKVYSIDIQHDFYVSNFNGVEDKIVQLEYNTGDKLIISYYLSSQSYNLSHADLLKGSVLVTWGSIYSNSMYNNYKSVARGTVSISFNDVDWVK